MTFYYTCAKFRVGWTKMTEKNTVTSCFSQSCCCMRCQWLASWISVYRLSFFDWYLAEWCISLSNERRVLNYGPDARPRSVLFKMFAKNKAVLTLSVQNDDPHPEARSTTVQHCSISSQYIRMGVKKRRFSLCCFCCLLLLLLAMLAAAINTFGQKAGNNKKISITTQQGDHQQLLPICVGNLLDERTFSSSSGSYYFFSSNDDSADQSGDIITRWWHRSEILAVIIAVWWVTRQGDRSSPVWTPYFIIITNCWPKTAPADWRTTTTRLQNWFSSS